MNRSDVRTLNQEKAIPGGRQAGKRRWGVAFWAARVWLFGLMVWMTPGTACAGDAELRSFFQEYLDVRLRDRPLEATRLGDHRFDDQLDDLTAAGRARRVALVERTLEDLPRRIKKSELSEDGRVDYDILDHDLRRELWLEANTDPWAEDPRIYNGYTTESVFLLLTQSTRPLETNVVNALARIGTVPRVLEAARGNLKRPPRVHTETAIRQNQGAITFYESELPALAVGSRHRAELAEAGRRVAADLRRYQEFLEKELLPRADGEWRLGPEKFRAKLELELDAGVTSDEVLAEAEREFLRVRQEMYVISRQLWSRRFPGEALPADDAEGRRETVRRTLESLGHEHGKPERLTRDVRRIVEDLRRFIRARDVVRLPEPDRCAVIEMPEFQRGNSTAYLNAAPPLDTQARSFYAVSPPPSDWEAAKVASYLEEYNAHMLPVLSIHEAYPGHYVQLEYGNRQRSAIRRIIQSGPYVEGWAVYTEQMMLDEGYRDGDLAVRLMQLKFYLRAVVNALLDHRMHSTSMTDDEAMELLVQQAFQSEGEARLKVIRAKQSSCQLSTYFVGRMAHYRLREAIQRELGERFVLGRYHEAVLAPGAVPPRFLPELVRARLQQPR